MAACGKFNVAVLDDMSFLLWSRMFTHAHLGVPCSCGDSGSTLMVTADEILPLFRDISPLSGSAAMST